MATTKETDYTYYAPMDIASDPIKVYDSKIPSESAIAIKAYSPEFPEFTPESAWWVNSKKECYLVWKNQIVKVGQYYFWGVQGDADEYLNPIGDIATLTEQRLVDGISEADIIGNAVPENLRMKKTYVGEIINEDNPTVIGGYIVVISDGIVPSLRRENDTIVGAGAWEKVKVFTDVNGKQHTVWCFPYRDSGKSETKYKNLEIR